MIYVFGFLLLVSSLVFCVFCVRTMMRVGFLLLPTLAFIFVIRVTMGLGIIPFLDLADIMFVGTNLSSIVFNYSSDPVVYFYQAGSHFIVLGLMTAALKLPVYQVAKHGEV